MPLPQCKCLAASALTTSTSWARAPTGHWAASALVPVGWRAARMTHNYSIAGGVTKTISSTLLADFRFGYFKYNPSTFKPDAGTTPMTSFGIPNANLTGPQAAFTSGLGGFLLNQTVSSSSANTGCVQQSNCELGRRPGSRSLQLSAAGERAAIPVGYQLDKDQGEPSIQIWR